jgi:hypothetical protein
MLKSWKLTKKSRVKQKAKLPKRKGNLMNVPVDKFLLSFTRKLTQEEREFVLYGLELINRVIMRKQTKISYPMFRSLGGKLALLFLTGTMFVPGLDKENPKYWIARKKGGKEFGILCCPVSDVWCEEGYDEIIGPFDTEPEAVIAREKAEFDK